MNLLNLHIYNYWRLSLVKLGHHCLGLMVMGLWLRVHILFYCLGNFLLFFIFFFGFLSFHLLLFFFEFLFSVPKGERVQPLTTWISTIRTYLDFLFSVVKVRVLLFSLTIGTYNVSLFGVGVLIPTILHV